MIGCPICAKSSTREHNISWRQDASAHLDVKHKVDVRSIAILTVGALSGRIGVALSGTDLLSSNSASLRGMDILEVLATG